MQKVKKWLIANIHWAVRNLAFSGDTLETQTALVPYLLFLLRIAPESPPERSLEQGERSGARATGAKAALVFSALDGFPRRFSGTAWPVNPAHGSGGTLGSVWHGDFARA
jgi:hypothetical protein